jgi:hypothetical protein
MERRGDILKAGQTIGHFKLIMKTRKGTGPYMIRKRWRVECSCGKRLTVPEQYLIRSNHPKTHCGCQQKTIKTTQNNEFRIWLMMHQRCYNTSHVAYKHYGGRGIGICPEWHYDSPDGKGFERFFNFVGPRPSMGHSIDRVDNDLGYQPFQADGTTRQVRWATASEQRLNQRPR